MSASILTTKPEEIASVKKRSEYEVSIIGCRRDGILHACLFAKAGFKVTCVDANRLAVRNIMRGAPPFLQHEMKPWFKKCVKRGNLRAINDVKQAVSESDIIAIITPTETDKKRGIDYSEMTRACKQVGSALRQGALVIIMSMVRPGTTQGLVRETLENASGLKTGYDFGLAYSPTPFMKEHAIEKLTSHKRIVAAEDKNSLIAASAVLQTIAEDGVITINDVRTAEAKSLFESIQYYVDTALANELALFCEKAELDYFQIRKLAETDAHGMFAWPSVSCRNAGTEPRFFFDESETSPMKLRMPAAARDVNQRILKHAIDLIKDALRNCGKSLRTARISLMGISRTPNARDAPKSSAKELAKTLKARGSKVSLYDPYFSGEELTDLGYKFHRRLKDAMKGVDCLVILTGHSRFKRLSLSKLKILGRPPTAIVDLEGIFDPETVQTKGFIFRGLGRGAHTK